MSVDHEEPLQHAGADTINPYFTDAEETSRPSGLSSSARFMQSVIVFFFGAGLMLLVCQTTVFNFWTELLYQKTDIPLTASKEDMVFHRQHDHWGFIFPALFWLVSSSVAFAGLVIAAAKRNTVLGVVLSLAILVMAVHGIFAALLSLVKFFD